MAVGNHELQIDLNEIGKRNSASKPLHPNMLSLLILPLLIHHIQACFHHSVKRDEETMAADIAAANLRKREHTRLGNRKIAITNVHVFDGFEYHNETSTVVIDGSIIGTNSTGAIEIDGNGGTLLPGLFDNHNHPTNLADLNNLSAYGVTTTMCMSCWTNSDLCASLRNQIGLTDLYSSGYSAVVPNSSHALFINATTVDNNAVIRNTSMCPGWVRDRITTGSDFIKLVAEAYEPTMNQAEHNAIVKASHELGYSTATHASTLTAYEMAIDSGSDWIQHTPADGLLNDSYVAKMVANGQHSTPTMNIYQNVEGAQVSLHLTDEQLSQLNQTIPANVKKLYDAGVPILAGTDSSLNYGGPALIPFGATLHKELELLVQAGVSNLDVLKAATSRPAQVYNMLDRGVIAPGLRADLLLVRGNPLVNISKTREIEKVWITGIEYDT